MSIYLGGLKRTKRDNTGWREEKEIILSAEEMEGNLNRGKAKESSEREKKRYLELERRKVRGGDTWREGEKWEE